MANNVIMPKQGLQMVSGCISKWYYKEGEQVKKGEPLFQMETDKLTIDIDSQFEGTLLKIIHFEGDDVPITEVIAVIGDKNETIIIEPKANIIEKATAPQIDSKVEKTAIPQTVSKAEKQPEIKPAEKIEINDNNRDSIFITPRAKMYANEKGIDYKTVKGSAPDGLIIERDVIKYAENKEKQQKSTFASLFKTDVDMQSFQKLLEAFKEKCDLNARELLNKIAVKMLNGIIEADKINIKYYGDTDIYEAIPALKDELFIFTLGKNINNRAMLAIIFNENVIDEKMAVEILLKVKKGLETPILAMSI